MSLLIYVSSQGLFRALYKAPRHDGLLLGSITLKEVNYIVDLINVSSYVINNNRIIIYINIIYISTMFYVYII